MTPEEQAAADAAARHAADAAERQKVTDLLHNLREENKERRLKAETLETENKRLADEHAAALAKEKTDREALTAAHEARLIRAELKAHAVAAGIVDLEGLKLIDVAGLKLNEAGEIEGAAELMAKVKEAKPWLFKAEKQSSSNTQKPPDKGDDGKKKATEMDTKEYAAAKAKALKESRSAR